ncbi:MAG: 4-hydroxy-tetrahydrodipicolinate reductase [Termitinemataceae bacterium]|nr:MAG: 4-hydroxy-tetrahydrodipicolinate reductase [Termitinemataceae bacterium]
MRKTNIIICGYGKMGTLIEERALEKTVHIAAIIDPASSSSKSLFGTTVYKSIRDMPPDIGMQDTEDSDSGANCVAIDFTNPPSVLNNVNEFAKRKIPLVLGTTGWLDKLPEVEKIIKDNGSSLLWSTNFSLGVNLFYRVAAYTSALINNYDDYDVAGWEIHHNQKADSPSGTAKTIAQIVLKNFTCKTKVVDEKLDRKPDDCELHFASMRCGSVPGTHALLFDSIADSIEIKHTARNREGLVSGALTAALWLSKKTSSPGVSGIWTMDDVLE